MSAHEIILAVMALFAAAGAVDRIFGGRLGLGRGFEEGILSMGALALSMAGIICLAPVLAAVLRPVIAPVYRLLGADPAMFAGTILANDTGGAALAMELAQTREAGLLGGVLAGSMLGATVVFSIPVALGLLEEADRPALAKGVLAGIVAIPLGVLAGGLTAGFSLGMILRNLTPIVLIALLIALGLWRLEGGMIRGFALFGRLVIAVTTLGLAAALVEAVTGFTLLPGMAPASEAIETVGQIALVLAGAFPLVHVLTRLLRRPLGAVGRWLGINDTAAAGFLASMANSIAMFGMVKEMDRRGKVLNIAFSVCAAFVFGDHLGFTAGFAPEMLVPVIVGKLTGGVAAVAAAMWLTKGEAHGQERA